jgi:hypothetical protein
LCRWSCAFAGSSGVFRAACLAACLHRFTVMLLFRRAHGRRVRRPLGCRPVSGYRDGRKGCFARVILSLPCPGPSSTPPRAPRASWTAGCGSALPTLTRRYRPLRVSRVPLPPTAPVAGVRVDPPYPHTPSLPGRVRASWQYFLTFPSVYAHSLLIGTLRMEMGDSAHIVCPKTGFGVVLTFHMKVRPGGAGGGRPKGKPGWNGRVGVRAFS